MGDTETAAPYLRAPPEQHRRVGVLCGEALEPTSAWPRPWSPRARRARPRRRWPAPSSRPAGSPVGTRHLLDRIHGTVIRSAPAPTHGLAAVDEAARAVRGPFETCPPCSINLTVPAAIACADAGDLERAAAYLPGGEQVAAAFYPARRLAGGAGRGPGARGPGQGRRRRPARRLARPPSTPSNSSASASTPAAAGRPRRHRGRPRRPAGREGLRKVRLRTVSASDS